jgi:hypothetical protein
MSAWDQPIIDCGSDGAEIAAPVSPPPITTA